MEDRVKHYLDYLDKEMSIMGVLSTFSVAVPSLLLERIIASSPQSIGHQSLQDLLSFGTPFLTVACALMFIAAAFFYKQRSLLAWYYGQTSLEMGLPNYTELRLDQWLRDADSWETWLPYNCAIWTSVFAAFSFLSAVLAVPSKLSLVSSLTCSLLICLGLVLWLLWIKKNSLEFKFSEKLPYLPTQSTFHKPPHYSVYARIARSKVHGVGVVAIQDISKGTHIFFSDDDKLLWIKQSDLGELSEEHRKLYEDFCIKKELQYGCPKNFNRITPAWFLNSSSTPNVFADINYRFYALRDIKRNEELTVDYATYSDP